MTPSDNIKPQKAWVVFSGKTDLPWLRFLKPGYRHCYALLFDGQNWVTVDPMSHGMDVHVQDIPAEFNMPLWLKTRGVTVVPASIERIAKQAPFSMFSCVEAVKRVLGIQNRWIVTPWQLYRHLLKTSQKTITVKENFSWEV